MPEESTETTGGRRSRTRVRFVAVAAVVVVAVAGIVLGLTAFRSGSPAASSSRTTSTTAIRATVGTAPSGAAGSTPATTGSGSAKNGKKSTKSPSGSPTASDTSGKGSDASGNATNAAPGSDPSTAGLSTQAAAFVTALQYFTSSTSEFESRFDALHGVPTVDEVAKIVAPYATALRHYQVDIAEVFWTLATQHDAGTIRDQLQSFIVFLRSIDTVSAADLGSWMKTVTVHEGPLGAANNKLSQDLGLSTS